MFSLLFRMAMPSVPPVLPATTLQARPCRECLHALALQGELWCLASAGGYTCSEERDLSFIRAIVLRACGPGGRFFAAASS
jgi:hypothetical protein